MVAVKAGETVARDSVGSLQLSASVGHCLCATAGTWASPPPTGPRVHVPAFADGPATHGSHISEFGRRARCSAADSEIFVIGSSPTYARKARLPRLSSPFRYTVSGVL